jgi:lipid A 3-O-deacylase
MRALAVAAFCVLTAQAAAASPIGEVRAGVFAQGLGPFSPNKEDGVALNGEVLFKPIGALRFIGAPRPHVGLSVATGEHATSLGYAGLTWRQGVASRLFVEGGVGVAVHDGETEFAPPDPLINERNYLGCRVLFRLSADLGVMLTDRLSASVHADHVSNAGLCAENEGLDNAGFRLGYRF